MKLIRLSAQFALLLMVAAAAAQATDVTPPAAVLSAERERVATVRKISLPTLAILDEAGGGGGSGVVISADGYALTNYHVSAPCGTALRCGMTDGHVYDAVIVGLDPTGDVALIKLLGREDFPAAELGDSDTVRPGEWVFVVGNPFLLADDFQPTVTYGIVSGVHRYQYPAGTILEYADCLQTDAAINPGNSGGPLFDAQGRLVGINGRGSFEKRGRVNVGVGYAISINQIKRFLGCLKSGRLVDHASLGATVTMGGDGRVIVDDILEDSDAFRRGMRYGDELVRFGGREIDTVNAFKNALGTYPADWRVPVTFRRDGREFTRLIRLSGHHRQGELIRLVEGGETPKPELPKRPDGEDVPELKPRERTPVPEIVSEHFEARRGFANYWFNRYHQRRVWNGYLAQTDLQSLGWSWRITGTRQAGGNVAILLSERAGSVTTQLGQAAADFTAPASDSLSPPRSGGLLAAIHAWQRLLIVGPDKFGELLYLGTLPWDAGERLADCLSGSFGGAEHRFYFDADTGDLIGLEFFAREDMDPCEVYFSQIQGEPGRRLPHRWEIRHGDDTYAVFDIASYDFTDTVED